MNKSIFLSILSIFIVTAGVGGLALAYFSDVGTSTANTFSTGSLNLVLSNNATTFTEDVTATWGDTDMLPNEFTPVGTLTLKNTGSVAGDHVDVAFANFNSDSTYPLDAVMRVTTLTYNGVNLLTGLNAISPNTYGLQDTNTSGYLELDELASQDLDQHNLSLNDLTPNTHDLVMQLQMSPGAGNDYQGDSVTTNLTVTLQQVPGE